MVPGWEGRKLSTTHSTSDHPMLGWGSPATSTVMLFTPADTSVRWNSIVRFTAIGT